MQRITEKHLEAKVAYLNELMGVPAKPWRATTPEEFAATGRGFKANIGNFHIAGAYGGWELHQMATEGGGVNTPLLSGYVPRRELGNLINAYITGVIAARSK